MLTFYWLLSLLLKIDAAIFEVNMLNYSKYIRKKTVLTTIGEATTKKIVP